LTGLKRRDIENLAVLNQSQGVLKAIKNISARVKKEICTTACDLQDFQVRLVSLVKKYV